MNVLVFNGSPKGDMSCTLQIVKLFEVMDPGHTWQVIHGARDVKVYEPVGSKQDEMLEQIKRADLILWSFPVYYMSVAGQYKRFIDILYRTNLRAALSGKATAVLSTSIHFFDHTSQATLRAICQDLGLRLVGSYSGHMEELTKEPGRTRLMANWQEWCRRMSVSGEGVKEFADDRSPTDLEDFTLDLAEEEQTAVGQVAVVGDWSTNANLAKMVRSLTDALSERVKLFPLADADIRQGCLGCCRCGMENICVQDNMDGFRHMLDYEILQSDTILFALDLNHRLFSWRFKQYLDRGFCHNHVPFYKGRKLGWLVAGDLTAYPHVQEMIRGLDQFMECLPIGMASDAQGQIPCRDQVRRLVLEAGQPFAAEKIPPLQFTGVAGRLIFRDAVYGFMRLIFPMDHRYYKKNGFYNFPQKKWKERILVWLMVPMLKIPPVRRWLQRNMITGMVRPFQKIVKGLKKTA